MTIISHTHSFVNTIFQKYALFPHLNVFENIAFGLRVKGTPEDEIKKTVHDMLSMVRQLQPTEWGLPIEMYFFTSDVKWVPHEHLQTEIVSHVLALAPLFDIRIYQAPTTMDLRNVNI